MKFEEAFTKITFETADGKVHVLEFMPEVEMRQLVNQGRGDEIAPKIMLLLPEVNPATGKEAILTSIQGCSTEDLIEAGCGLIERSIVTGNMKNASSILAGVMLSVIDGISEGDEGAADIIKLMTMLKLTQELKPRHKSTEVNFNVKGSPDPTAN